MCIVLYSGSLVVCSLHDLCTTEDTCSGKHAFLLFPTHLLLYTPDVIFIGVYTIHTLVARGVLVTLVDLIAVAAAVSGYMYSLCL